MFPAPGLRHALVHGDLQVHLPAPALGIGTVLPVGHGSLLPLLLLLRLYNRETVLHTQLVRRTAQCHETFLVAVILETSVAAYRVDDEVGVNVIPVGVGCHYDFEAGDLRCQLQGNFMCHLRGDRIVGPEGLNHVVVQPTFGTVVQALGVHKFL